MQFERELETVVGNAVRGTTDALAQDRVSDVHFQIFRIKSGEILRRCEAKREDDPLCAAPSPPIHLNFFRSF
jgi:hypothetical protein